MHVTRRSTRVKDWRRGGSSSSGSEARSKQRTRRNRRSLSGGRGVTTDTLEAPGGLRFLAAAAANPGCRRPQRKAVNKVELLVLTGSVEASKCCRTRWRPEPSPQSTIRCNETVALTKMNRTGLASWRLLKGFKRRVTELDADLFYVTPARLAQPKTRARDWRGLD